MCVCVCIYWASRNEKSEVFFVYAEQSKAQGIHKMPVSKPHCSCQKLLFQLQREKGSSNKKKKVRIQERKKSGKALLAEREKAVPTCPMTNNTRRENPDGLHKRSFLFSLLPRFPPRFACNFFSTAKSRCTTDMRCQSLQLSRKKTRCFFFLLLQNFKSQEHASSKVLAKKEEKQKRQHKALNITQNKKGGKKRRLIVESLRRKRPGKKKRYS